MQMLIRPRPALTIALLQLLLIHHSTRLEPSPLASRARSPSFWPTTKGTCTPAGASRDDAVSFDAESAVLQPSGRLNGSQVWSSCLSRPTEIFQPLNHLRSKQCSCGPPNPLPLPVPMSNPSAHAQHPSPCISGSGAMIDLYRSFNGHGS
ncbi:hypothetical protein BDZ85DRAFT_132317 [Elsinoe ampelina]|uniref:Secreted protein n=1 Tax=Elsinoe ampelina TaxID=302913 RepID=A0A6A6G8I5_9PEZI|nr:hypothetical protein BDZ85DRAFT_132317 [Elsinoe ampelina]